MKKYIGVKIVEAKPLTLAEYCKHEGYDVPEEEDISKEGYLVKCSDDYVSWCSKEQFEEANHPTDNMPFGHAIEAARKGNKIARSGWNGKNMFVVYMSGMYLPPYNTQGTERKVNDRTAKWIGEDTPLDSQPYFAMFTSQGKWQPGWLASQQDLLATDWQIVE